MYKRQTKNKEYAFSGISLVNASQINNLKSVEESIVVIDDKRIGLNINTKDDYELLSST